MKPNLKNTTAEKHPKLNLYPSDFGKLEADILLALRGTEPTNPPQWNDTLKWAAGKGVEVRMVEILVENGIMAKDYSQDGDSFKMERMGVPVSMRFDGLVSCKDQQITIGCEDGVMPQSVEVVLKNGEPIEIKSINNKNEFDIAKYMDNKPKDNYVGQLAMYMDALGKDTGHLFASTIDGLHTFWFVCRKIGEGKYQAGDTIVDVNAEYERWAKIWAKFKEGGEPNWFEEIYKLSLEKVNWTTLSKYVIGEARNGRKVIGSENKWKVDYSPYKKIIVEKQGATLGYTEAELVEIKRLTAGFSAKPKVTA